MKKILKIIIPSILMLSLIYIWRNGKDILTGIYIVFPIIYIIIGLISNKKLELLINSILLSTVFLISINLYFNMGTCLELVCFYNIISWISFFIKNKLKKVK